MSKLKTQTITRLCDLPTNNSFFLFGARGTGKTTLLNQVPFLKKAMYIDLLKSDMEEKYALRPELLLEQGDALESGEWIIIDEIQKIPKLLDHVHFLIEKKNLNFALTGSSSRKLKRGGANLLAGRAFSLSLYPFCALEIGADFDLDMALAWGTLPKMFDYHSDRDRSRFLKSYAQTYLREEIVVEQLVRNLDPFRLFLPIAAQMNTQTINYSNISRDTGVDYKTVQNYYQILVDTNLGFFLEPSGRSIRKVQKQSPKFYFFDTGVKRALNRMLSTQLEKRTSDYGEAFESWFVNECHRLNHYFERDYQFSYLRTKDDAEVDLIIDRPSQTPILLEIKSSSVIDDRHVKNLLHFSHDFPGSPLICACCVTEKQKIGSVMVLPWREALQEIGLGENLLL